MSNEQEHEYEPRHLIILSGSDENVEAMTEAMNEIWGNPAYNMTWPFYDNVQVESVELSPPTDNEE